MYQLFIAVGRLGKDVEIQETNSGHSVGRFSVAVDRSWKGKDGQWQKETEWFNCVLWDDKAKSFAGRAHKGTLVFIEGEIRTRKYTTSSGEERRTTEVYPKTTRVLDKKEGGSSGGYGPPPPQGPPASHIGWGSPSGQPSGQAQPAAGGGEDLALDDDLPF